MTTQETANQPAISIRGVRKTYRKGDVEVTPLEGVDLDIAPGEFFALMGPSGSGKSTLLNLVAGIDKPTAGRVIVDGQDITDWTEDELADWRTRAVGYVFQQFNLISILTAYENIELPLLLLPISKEKRHSLITAALELVGLSDRANHYPRQLSGGQEQRVAIARALATDPKVVVADEPTGNLDRTSGQGVMDLLSSLKKTVLVVTHDPAVARRARRVMHLDKGVLVEGHAAADDGGRP